MIKLERIMRCKALSWEQLGFKMGVISSPFRQDQKPSLSLYIKGGFSYWKDHATGEGGSIIDFVQSWKGLTFPATIEFIEDLLSKEIHSTQQTTINNISKRPLLRIIKYSILPSNEAAEHYLLNVRHIAPTVLSNVEFYTVNITHKTHRNAYIAFPINRSTGSYECRAIEAQNPVKQRKIGAAGLWQYGEGDDIIVTESIIDALSWLTMCKFTDDITLISLNSVTNWRKLFELDLSNRRVTLMLDNDQVGDITTKHIADKIGILAEDARGVFRGFKDLNEKLCRPTTP